MSLTLLIHIILDLFFELFVNGFYVMISGFLPLNGSLTYIAVIELAPLPVLEVIVW